MSNQPIIVLNEGSQRVKNKEAQSNNILAAKAVAEAVRTTLGPKGMDKMLIDSMGDIVITNDGATILKEMDIEHPAAKIIVEVSKTQDEEVGDGTTTAAILAGELLKNAETLIDIGVHPTVVAAGYYDAAEKSIEILNNLAFEVTTDDVEKLKCIAETAITGKGIESYKSVLSELAVNAVRTIAEKTNSGLVVDIDDIKIEKIPGGSIQDSELVYGVTVDKERAHTNMPKRVENAKILLLSIPLEIKKTEVTSEIKITTPDQISAFLDQEEGMLKSMVDKVIKSGANTVFCQKGMDDMVEYYLAKENIFAVSRVKKSDLEKLTDSTNANIIQNLDEITESDIGSAGLIEEKNLSGKEIIFVTECATKSSVSIILKGGTEHVVDSAKLALDDALRVIGVTLEDGKVVVGGGSTEIELALRLREFATTVSGRKQLAINKFSEAIEIVPKTLAENSGLDSIDTLVELRSNHETGNKNMGLNVFTSDVVDMLELNVIEPLRIKTQAINTGSEAAIMILKIDDVVASKGGPSGGGMPPMGM
ncbi:MAG: TCP-1/cpn60 chaperonin family protein [Methanosarcinaceae archaeon]|nr:TCP-1/cpn60 chaperonin family protein [Methanosarcinaceae archaeon]